MAWARIMVRLTVIVALAVALAVAWHVFSGPLWLVVILHCVPPKICDHIFYNNFNNKCPITIIFGIVSGKSMCHRKIVSFPTSPI